MPIKLTIIGAGPGGYVAAIRAAQRGAHVTVIENSEVGGVCLNQGCIPTKALIASANALARMRNAVDYGLEVTGTVGYNLAGICERKDKIVATQVRGIRSLFKSWGVNLIEGRGALLAPDIVRAVRKDGTTLDFKSDRIIIATGSRPARIPHIDFDGADVISSDEAVQFKKIPKSILIVGAGVIGCEFAFIYRMFGAEVTLAEMLPRSLSTEDEDMAGIIEREFKKTKIRFFPGVKVEKIEKRGNGSVVTTLTGGRNIETEMVLVSIGRSMNSEGLGLDALGIARGGRGEILVNEKLETNVAGIYAVGDVTGKFLLAHVASHQGLAAVENALGGGEKMDYAVVPSGIFTMPEIGSVGLREADARNRNIAYRIGTFPYRALGKAHAMGEITGMAKIISSAQDDSILGVHICGAHAADLIHEGALAIRAGVTAGQLGSMIHAHPTLAEAVMEAAEDVHTRAIHLPRKER